MRTPPTQTVTEQTNRDVNIITTAELNLADTAGPTPTVTAAEQQAADDAQARAGMKVAVENLRRSSGDGAMRK